MKSVEKRNKIVSNTQPNTEREFTAEEMQSALFAQMVMQQANMAFMLMGKVPHPETGKPVRDLDAAKLFVDQLEMLEAKTKGNLNTHEANLLKQTLMSLRMSFVDAVNSPGPEDAEKQIPPADQATTPEDEKSPPAEAAGEDQSGKRFSKKYS